MLNKDKEFYEKIMKRKLLDEEVVEAGDNLVGFFDLLYRIDKKSEEKGFAEPKNRIYNQSE